MTHTVAHTVAFRAGRQVGRGLVWGNVLGMLLALLACACAEPQHPTECELSIDPAGFTDDELAIVLDAIAEWDQALGGLVRIKPSISLDGCEHAEHCISAGTLDRTGDERVTGRSDMFRWNGIQWVGHQQRVTLYMTAIHGHGASSDYWLRHTVLHELGHHLGLGHNNEAPHTLMHPYGQGPPCIGPAEVARLSGLYGARARKATLVPTCKPADLAALSAELEILGL